ncbi:40S ribosomal protein S5-1 [Hordeum vulgare]|nr:40S ribosomal protein S5-1 [Hordeum vulgare]
MFEGMLHICDVERPKKTGSMEARLEAMEKQVFKCQGMVEHGLNVNHMMIMDFTNKHKIDANDIGKHLSRLYDRIDHLQTQIYDLQNQKCDYYCPATIVAHANVASCCLLVIACYCCCYPFVEAALLLASWLPLLLVTVAAGDACFCHHFLLPLAMAIAMAMPMAM